MTINEAIEKDRARRRAKRSWGPWLLLRSNWTLVYSYRYEIDLETIHNSSQMLDWIFQIEGKSWASEKTVGYLIRAFADIFDPQGNLCSLGQDHSIKEPATLMEKRMGK